jgi:hypothetical protein
MDIPSYRRNKRLLRWTYYCLGGVYSSRNFTLFTKCAYFGLKVVAIFLVDIVGVVGYLLTANVITFLDIVSITFMPSVLVFVLAIIPFITHRYHREFETLFDYMENCAIVRSQSATSSSSSSATGFRLVEKVDSIAESLGRLKVVGVVCAVYVSVGAVDILLFCEQENSYRNLQHHMFPTPYLDRIPSISLFWILYAIESAVFMFACVSALPEVTFVSMITNEFNNIVTEYCEHMQNAAEYLIVAAERHFQRWNTNSWLMETLFRRFENDLRFFITEHQRLIK